MAVPAGDRVAARGAGRRRHRAVPRRPMPLAWTSPWVRVLDDQQCQHRDGPGLRALHTQLVVTCGRADLRTRWPALSRTVTDVRVRAVHAEPLPVNHQPVGVLALYCTTHTTVDPVPERLTAVKDARP